MTKKNIFVIGLERFNLEKLKTIRNAADYNFHGLMDYKEVVKPLDYPYDAMLAKAERELRDFPGHIDAIISHWDFPVDTMLPILCERFGLPGPSLESVLRLGHKYWARLEQQKYIPEHIPRFCAVDPYADDPLKQIDLDFPFWIKPVKSFGSYLGFHIHSEEEFHRRIETVRASIPRIGNAFNTALGHAQLPPEVEGIGGNHLIAEEVITGDRQNGPEGYVYNGEVFIHGITDTVRDEWNRSFIRYEYPSVWPEHMQKKSVEVARRLLANVGLDNAPFNLEFIWDEDSGALTLIEVNPRISQSLSGMFEMAHGASNHEVAVEAAGASFRNWSP